MSGIFCLQASFLPLIIDKWCLETAVKVGRKAVIFSQGLPIKRYLLFALQHALFYLGLASLLLGKKQQMVVLPHAFSTPPKNITNSKQGGSVDPPSYFLCTRDS